MRYDRPKLLPTSAIARWLKVDADWLRDEAEAGRLPHVQAGDCFLFDPDAVELALLERARHNKKEQNDG